ncbi:CGNR zinc finger domain-containing protein [Nesterenkonia rhizosphaerae]|uniref:Zinc finger CGNR domain-containing protein n=1 Tax=Nesterenkonia rhizosphaerae TaxID=1348272 RepID=A0ABP9FQT7_9MICC
MFNAEVNRALTAAAELINTGEGLKSAKHTPDTLHSVEGLKAYVASQDPELEWTTADASRKQVEKVRHLREQLRKIWTAAPITDEQPVELINELLKGVGTKLVATDGDSSGLCFQQRPVPLSDHTADVMTATVAAALTHLVVEQETGRLRICKGDDCEAAIVDLTRNRSKLFCDFGNCANRAHVRAYRARQAARRGEESAAPVHTEELAAAAAEQSQGSGRKLVKPSAAEKAESINRPTSASAIAAKEFRDRMREELMEKRGKKQKKAKKKASKG